MHNWNFLSKLSWSMMIWCYWHKAHEIILLPPWFCCHGNHSRLARKFSDSGIGKKKKTQPTSCIKWITSTCKEKKKRKLLTLNQLLLFYFFLLIRTTEQAKTSLSHTSGNSTSCEVCRWHLGIGCRRKKSLKIHIILRNSLLSKAWVVLSSSWVKPLSCLLDAEPK